MQAQHDHTLATPGDSEERLRQVVENVSEGILVAQDGRFRYANRAALALTGYTAAEIEGQEFLPLVHPDDRPKVIDHHMRRLRGEEVELRYDFRVLTKAGDTRWVQLSAVMIEWDAKPATLSFISDITERTLTEQALRASEERYRSVVEGAPIGIVIVRDNRIRYANPEFARAMRSTTADVLGWGSFLEHVHAEDRERIEAFSRNAVSRPTGDMVRIGYRIVRTDGSTLPVYVSAIQIEWEGRRATLAFVQDISERQRLEEDLKLSLAEREAILQSTLVGITYSVQRRHQWVNRRFAEMVGWEPEELIGQSSLVHFSGAPVWTRFGEEVYPVLAKGRAYSTELEVTRRDGSRFWGQLHGVAINPADLTRGAIWTLVDITARKKAEEDIRAALDKQRELNLLKSRFVAMTSHEFRTPLATILSSSQLLRRYGERLPENERGELYDTIETAVKRMTTMLEDILIIGRAESERLDFAPAPLRLVPFCERALADARTAAPARAGASHELLLDCAAGDAEVRLDEKLLRHIVDNLLANAIKYSPDGGRITLSAAVVDGSARFEISDAGIGMSQEELPRLYEAFYRASNVGGISGTGLGLAIVRHCVDLHGGSIDIQSALGKGTRCTVVLPCA